MTVPNKTTELRKKIEKIWDINYADKGVTAIMRLIERTVLDVIGEDTLNIPDNDPGWLRMQNQLKASQRDHLHKIVKGD